VKASAPLLDIMIAAIILSADVLEWLQWESFLEFPL